MHMPGTKMSPSMKQYKTKHLTCLHLCTIFKYSSKHVTNLLTFSISKQEVTADNATLSVPFTYFTSTPIILEKIVYFMEVMHNLHRQLQNHACV